MGLSNGNVSVEDIMTSRLCSESLEIAKGTMFLSFLPVFANQNHCVPSYTEPESSFQLGWDPELLSMALTHVWNFFWLQ